jgi:hypothetical protein
MTIVPDVSSLVSPFIIRCDSPQEQSITLTIPFFLFIQQSNTLNKLKQVAEALFTWWDRAERNHMLARKGPLYSLSLHKLF